VSSTAHVPSPGLDDLLLQVVQTLTESKDVVSRIDMPQMVLTVVDIAGVHRFFRGRETRTNELLQLRVPTGKVWKVHSISCIYTASAAVANRDVRVDTAGGSGQLQDYFKETLAASAVGQYQLGSPAPSANPGTYDTCDVQPVLCESAVIRFYADSGGQAADTLALVYLIEEWMAFVRK